jgi:hypothetical protein
MILVTTLRSHMQNIRRVSHVPPNPVQDLLAEPAVHMRVVADTVGIAEIL